MGRLAGTRVVVLNATMEPLAIVPLHRALMFLVHERATIVEAREGETIRSASTEFPVPLVVAFRELVRVLYRWSAAPWTRRGVLTRDGRQCAYCGRTATTIDHLTPRSRGGENSWLNTVAACIRCNNAKADRTPEEARMPLRFPPREVTRRDTLVVAMAQLGADVAALGLA